MNHLSGNQSREINRAVSHGEEASEHITNLISIIEDLDAKISEKEAEIDKLNDTIMDLDAELRRALP